MAKLEDAIIKAILKAFLRHPGKLSVLRRLWLLFSLVNVPLQRYEPDHFHKLREEAWQIDEQEYSNSFQQQDERGKPRLHPLAELGYSGSTFFETLDHKYLVKSLPRSSESSFFRDELRESYYHYMQSRPESLLVRITDFLFAPCTTIGGILQLVPNHHVVMENILHGKDEDSKAGKWETYDLKPADYFYPERDVMNGNLSSDAAKDKVVDIFNDKIRITGRQFQELRSLVEEDTDFLKAANAVDYSLLLIRYPAESLIKPGGTWRSGILTYDKKWVYRAIILDFFWAKHQLPAKAMTGLINSYNIVDRQGPMSLTTSAAEFKERFGTMVDALVDTGS